MCWISDEVKKEIAPRDIITYKVLCPIDDKTARAPIYRTYMYTRGKHNPYVTITPEYDEVFGTYIANEGYHSYTEIPDISDLNYGESIYKMIIPKGTVYYKSNKYKVIISSNIIMQCRILFNGKFKNFTLFERLKYFWNKKIKMSYKKLEHL